MDYLYGRTHHGGTALARAQAQDSRSGTGLLADAGAIGGSDCQAEREAMKRATAEFDRFTNTRIHFGLFKLFRAASQPPPVGLKCFIQTVGESEIRAGLVAMAVHRPC